MEPHRRYLELALAQAEQAAREGTYPIGAVIVGPDGEVLSTGRNRVYSADDTTAHAEVDAIRRAGARLWLPPYERACTIYTSMEPCLMCAGAILLAHIPRVVWATNDDLLGAIRRLTGGPYRPDRFAALEVVAAPFPDLDRRQRQLMAAWDDGRGRDGSFWLRSGTD